MGTVVAIETAAGAVLAADKRTLRRGTVTEGPKRVFDLDGAGAAAVGDQGDVDEFGRRLESEVRSDRTERDRKVNVDRLARVAAEVASAAGVDAVVAAHDEDGVARIRQVDDEGAVLEGPFVALGSGAQIATGRLEGADRDRALDAAEDLARETLETVAERDPETGEEITVWSLASEDAE
jgi:proteasome beta subunit